MAWREGDLVVTVQQPKEGFWSSVNVVAKIPLPPHAVFDVLTDPDNRSTFKSIKKVNFHKVLKDDGKGKKTVEVEHVGRWKYGIFAGQFTVRLLVRQDRNKGKIRFDLQPIRNNFMRNFSGEWTIAPYDEDSLDEMVRYPGRRWGAWHSVSKAVHRLEDRLAHKEVASLVKLNQQVAPAITPPAPLDRVLKKVTLAQVRIIMEDLMGATERIREEKRMLREKQEAENGGGGVDIFSFCKSVFDLEQKNVL